MTVSRMAGVSDYSGQDWRAKHWFEYAHNLRFPLVVLQSSSRNSIRFIGEAGAVLVAYFHLTQGKRISRKRKVPYAEKRKVLYAARHVALALLRSHWWHSIDRRGFVLVDFMMQLLTVFHWPQSSNL